MIARENRRTRCSKNDRCHKGGTSASQGAFDFHAIAGEGRMDETKGTSEATDQAEVASRAIGDTTLALGSRRDEVNSGSPLHKARDGESSPILPRAKPRIIQQTRPSWPLPNLLMIRTHQPTKTVSHGRTSKNTVICLPRWPSLPSSSRLRPSSFFWPYDDSQHKMQHSNPHRPTNLTGFRIPCSIPGSA